MVVLLAAVDPKSSLDYIEFMSLNTLILLTDDFMKKFKPQKVVKLSIDLHSNKLMTTTFIRRKCFLFRSVINFVSQICPIIKFSYMMKNDLCA